MKANQNSSELKPVQSKPKNNIQLENNIHMWPNFKIANIFKDLHQNIYKLLTAQKNEYSNFISTNDTLLDKSKKSQLFLVQTAIDLLQVEIKKIVRKWDIYQQNIQRKLNSSINSLQLIKQNKLYKHSIQALIQNMRNSLKKLSEQIIKQDIFQDSETQQLKVTRYSGIGQYQRENNQLREYIRKLEQKYKHVLFEQKSTYQYKKSQRQNSNEHYYGRKEVGEYPMRISVQILQKKIRQLQKENIHLKKSQNLDCMSLIQQLQNQIKMLRKEQILNLRTSRKALKHNFQNIYERDDPYYMNHRKVKIYPSTAAVQKPYKQLQNNNYNLQTPIFETQKYDSFQNNLQRKRQISVPTKLRPKLYF